MFLFPLHQTKQSQQVLREQIFSPRKLCCEILVRDATTAQGPDVCCHKVRRELLGGTQLENQL